MRDIGSLGIARGALQSLQAREQGNESDLPHRR